MDQGIEYTVPKEGRIEVSYMAEEERRISAEKVKCKRKKFNF